MSTIATNPSVTLKPEDLAAELSAMQDYSPPPKQPMSPPTTRHEGAKHNNQVVKQLEFGNQVVGKPQEAVKQPVQQVDAPKQAEPVKQAQLVKHAEPVKSVEPVKVAEAVKQAEPVKQPEAVKQVEALKLPEAVKQVQQPVNKQPEPAPQPAQLRMQQISPDEQAVDDMMIEASMSPEEVGLAIETHVLYF